MRSTHYLLTSNCAISAARTSTISHSVASVMRRPDKAACICSQGKEIQLLNLHNQKRNKQALKRSQMMKQMSHAIYSNATSVAFTVIYHAQRLHTWTLRILRRSWTIQKSKQMDKTRKWLPNLSTNAWNVCSLIGCRAFTYIINVRCLRTSTKQCRGRLCL